MQLGELRRVIRIDHFTLAADGNNQEIKTWSKLATVWAKVSYVSGGEVYEADQRVALRIAKFFIRYRSDVDETCRILYDTKYYDILGIEEVDRKRFLVIKCQYADRDA